MNTDIVIKVEDAAKECIDFIKRLLGSDSSSDDITTVESRMDVWKSDIVKLLESKSPYKIEKVALENAKNPLSFENLSSEELIEEVHDIEYFGNDIDSEYWIDRCKQANFDELVSIKNGLNELWTRLFEEKQSSWSENTIEEEKKKVIDELEERAEAVIELNRTILSFGNGYLGDFAGDSLFSYDTSQLQQWAHTFENDENVRRICELLGRLTARSVFKSVKDYKSVSHKVQMKDINSKEELCGIELGSRLEDLLPSELGLLNDRDCEVLFDLKYVENRLLCFAKEGYTTTDEERLEEVRRMESENMGGPIIFCIDTSGSMYGEPERIAKAVTLYIAMKAVAENRSCYVINFSSEISAIDITPPNGIGELLSFMGTSFYGGTDPLPALNHAIDMTGVSKYKKADIIMISDFIMNPAGFGPLMDKIHRSKRRQCKYHSLIVSDYGQSDNSGVFDYSWKYSPKTGSIVDLLNMSNRVTGC